MDRMRILVAASEATPFAKTGGLGDVVGALPKELARLGHEVVVFLPQYKSVDLQAHRTQKLDWTVTIPVAGKNQGAQLESVRDRKLPLTHYFVHNEPLFGRDGIYVDPRTGTDYVDNDLRYSFFARAVMESLRELGWKPDIIHVHDWQAGIIPVLLRTVYASDSFFRGVKSVLTIHNLAYQGVFPRERFTNLSLPEELFYATGPLEFYEKVNFLKGAIMFADRITTVSPNYAREIQSDPEFGCGMEGVLRNRANDVVGILNGVDYTVWSPSRDRVIPYRYHLPNLSGKRSTQVELLNRAGLPVRERTPVIGMISRLVDQKGLDLIDAAADRLFGRDIQMLVLGTGEQRYHDQLLRLQKQYPDKLKVWLTFDDDLAHWIEAGSDIFLMPSRFEPCGLNQMYSLKYGTVPIVHLVGGLADTVDDYNPDTGEGTGFVFTDYTPEAMLAAVDRASELFTRKRAWTRLMKSGMKQDFSWASSAARYQELFGQLVTPT